MIPNHFTGSLSDLDLRAARAVSPGGNWKQIPSDIPLKRLETIRQSFARGEGSRSTYYGRLHPDRPAYTINTYFSRPGNGCHLHPEQDRVISQREAARFQSFPDDFVFYGSKASINVQIGNAVPPLLGFQIAHGLGEPGGFIDLFSGAGGLSLGFKWAGWAPVVANDVVPEFLDTFAANIHPNIVLGDVRSAAIKSLVLDQARVWRKANTGPLWLIGGPPCQGFSTAGKPRSMDDVRNQLFHEYEVILGELRPDGFVFENVTGLLNMDGGAVFQLICSRLRKHCETLSNWVLSAENHAVPQKRRRVIVVGSSSSKPPSPPTMLTRPPDASLLKLPVTINVREAIYDLPPLVPGQDGSNLDYRTPPQTDYQRLMRGELTPGEYIRAYEGTLAAAV